MSHLQLYRATKSLCATVHVATATSIVATSMASSDSNDDIRASSLVSASSNANQERKLNPHKKEKNMGTISGFVHSVCEGGS